MAPPQFIYLLRPTRLGMLTEGPTAEEAATLQGHVEYLADLTNQQIVLLAGRTQTADTETFGIVIFRALDQDAATQIMANDPAVADGVMTATLFPYRIASVAPSIIDNAP